MSSNHQLPTLVNFCSEMFVSNVCCGSVTADGYSPLNLVSSDLNTRCKGFRVEHYIRPPITIELDFCVPVSITSILLCPNLPPGAEMRVELTGSTRTEQIQQKLSQRPVVIQTSDAILIFRNQQVWKNFGQEIVAVPEMVKLVHRSFASNDLKKFELIECPLKQINILHRLKHIQLKVIKWTGPRPVTLKWMEVWGKVGANCSKEETSLFHNCLTTSTSLLTPVTQHPSMFREDCTGANLTKYRQHKLHNIDSTRSSFPLGTGAKEVVALSSCSRANAVSVGESSAGISNGLTSISNDNLKVDNIFEKFLDELTFEMMALPMLLPSGHYVDQTTLDKLAQSDVAAGRPPTDPFTGIPFTEHCKPKFCMELKAQLDACTDSHVQVEGKMNCPSGGRTVSLIGRTVGSSKEIQKHLLETSKKHISADSMSLTSKRIKLDCQEMKQATSPYSSDIEHPASAAPSLMVSSHSTHHTDHKNTTNDRMCRHAATFDLEVGDSLNRALHQLFHKTKQHDQK